LSKVSVLMISFKKDKKFHCPVVKFVMTTTISEAADNVPGLPVVCAPWSQYPQHLISQLTPAPTAASPVYTKLHKLK